MAVSAGMKRCHECGVSQDAATAFSKLYGSLDGYDAYDKVCRVAVENRRELYREKEKIAHATGSSDTERERRPPKLKIRKYHFPVKRSNLADRVST